VVRNEEGKKCPVTGHFPDPELDALRPSAAEMVALKLMGKLCCEHCWCWDGDDLVKNGMIWLDGYAEAEDSRACARHGYRTHRDDSCREFVLRPEGEKSGQ